MCICIHVFVRMDQCTPKAYFSHQETHNIYAGIHSRRARGDRHGRNRICLWNRICLCVRVYICIYVHIFVPTVQCISKLTSHTEMHYVHVQVFTVTDSVTAPAATGTEGIEVEVEVTFEPGSIGSANARLIVTSDEGGQYVCILNGYGLAPK